MGEVFGLGSELRLLGVLVYVGLRFGWLWAVGYAVADHLIKTVGPPALLTTKQVHRLLLARAEKTAPKIAPHMAEVFTDGADEPPAGSD